MEVLVMLPGHVPVSLSVPRALQQVALIYPDLVPFNPIKYQNINDQEPHLVPSSKKYGAYMRGTDVAYFFKKYLLFIRRASLSFSVKVTAKH